MKYIISIVFVFWSTLAISFAQTGCPEHRGKQPNDEFRFQRPEYQRYQAGTVTVGGLPVVGGIWGNRDTFSLDLGIIAEVGLFSVNRLWVGLEVAYVYAPTKPEADYNHQRFSTKVLYFLSDKRRATLFGGVMPYIHRWNYESSQGFQFFDDPVDGRRRTHWVPGNMFLVGGSLKLGLNWSTQLSIAYNSTVMMPGRNPSAVPIQYGLWFKYHLRSKN